MLPTLKENKLYGYDKMDWQSKMLSKALSEYKSDGVTNANGVTLTRRINQYLEDSLKTMVLFTAIRRVMEILLENENEKDVIARVSKVNRFAIEHTRNSIWKILKSLKKQRELLKSVKKMVKTTRITDDWKAIIDNTLKSCEDRLLRFSKIQMDALMSNTPMTVYLDYLKENGISFEDDVEEYSLSKSIFDDTDIPEFIEYSAHVIKIISENITADQINRICNSTGISDRADARRKEIYDREKKEREDRRRKEIRELVYGLSCDAAKNYRRTRSDKKRVTYANAYIITACRLFNNGKVRPGYIKKSGGNTYQITKDIGTATVFRTVDEAEKYILTLGDNVIAAVSSLYTESVA